MPTPQVFLSSTLALVAGILSAADIPFAASRDIAGGAVSGTSSIDAGDLNGDSRPDVVLVEGGMHAGGRKTFAWFEAPANPQSTWIRHDLNNSAPLRPFLGAAKLADFDGDGDLDLVVSSDNHSGGTRAADLYVFVNPGAGSVNGTWSYHRMTPSTLALHHINDMEVVDIDDDGKLDVVCRSLEPNQIHIFFQNSINSWTRRTLDTGIVDSEGLAAGQIDNDRYPDITFTGHWFKTPSDPRNGTYVKYNIDSTYKNTNQNTKESLADIDGDGDLDIVIGPAESYRDGANHDLAWYRNPGTNYGSNWAKTVVRSNTNNHHTVKLADMNGDGHPDILTGIAWSNSGTTKSILIYQNNGSGGFGSAQTVVSGKGLYSGVAIDVGNDGDLDIIGQDTYSGSSKPWFYENTSTSTPPVTLPSAPTGLVVNALSSSRIDLTWSDTANNESGFVIERQIGSGSFTQIASLGANATAYSNTGLTPATAYTYRVRAFNSAGNSAWSNTAGASTAAAPVIDATTRIEAESYSSQSGVGIYSGGSGQKIGAIQNGDWARFAAVDFASGVTSVQVRGSSGGAGGTISFRLDASNGPVIGSVAIPATGGWNNFQDFTAAISGASGVHDLYLVFVGGSGSLLDVDYFQFGSAPVADTTPPSAPTGAQATPSSPTAITVQWVAATDNIGVTGYELSRNGAVIATPSGTTYADSGLNPQTVYAYSVRARDAAGNWSVPATVSATTPALPTGSTAFTTIQAEAYHAMQGVGTYAADVGQKIGAINNGDWVRFNGLDFGSGAASVTARVSSNAAAGGSIQFRLGSTTGPLVATVTVSSTGGWNTFVERSATVSGASGVHDLFLVFTGGSGALLDVDWFRFTAGGASDTQAPSVPGSLAASSSQTAVTLSWSAATDNVGVTGYEVSRNGSVIATPTGTTYSDTGLQSATTYAYSVRARDAAGNWSTAANITATTQASTAPTTVTIQAESYDAMQGIGIYAADVGQKIGSIHNGEWARYQGVDFGSGAIEVTARVSSNTAGGSIQFRLGSSTGPLVATITVPSTGGWNTFVERTATVSGASGVQDLYLVFVGGSGFLLDVDWFRFTTEAEPELPLGNG